MQEEAKKKNEEGLTLKVLYLSARLGNVGKPGRRIRTQSRRIARSNLLQPHAFRLLVKYLTDRLVATAG